MEARTALMRWQQLDPDTGEFDAERTTREYADLLGVSESYLSLIYRGRRPNCPKAVAARSSPAPRTAHGRLPHP